MKSITSRLYPLRNIIALILKLSLFHLYIREIVQKRKVTIIYYHSISPILFQEHIKYLKKRYSLITLDLFLEAIYHGNKAILPAKSLIITFDDGFAENARLIPIIRQYSVPITFFICSDLISTKRHFWFKEAGDIEIDLMKVTNDERLKLLSEIGFYNNKEYQNEVALNNEQIRELISTGCNIQSHTSTHAILPMCEESVARDEISNSKWKLEKNLDIKVNYISFPNGDYSEREIRLCKQAGYRACLTSDLGFNDINSDPYRLKRICMNDEAGVSQLSLMVTGIWSSLVKIMKTK